MATTIDADGLLADLGDLAPKPGHRTCHTRHALDQLDAELATAIEAVIDRTDLAITDICRVLTRHGLNVSTDSISRHRKRGTPTGCRCPRASEAE